MYTLKFMLVQNLGSLSWFSFSSTFISCHQRLTAVDSWWQLIWKKIEWNFHLHTKVYTYAKFQLSSLILIFINFYQLSSAINSWKQPIWQRFVWNIFIHTKVYTCVEFYLSRLIFIFISCWQLLSAVDSWWQLLRKKIKWNFDILLNCDVGAKFELCRLLEGPARECDAQADRQRHACQVIIMLTPALLGWWQGLSWAICFRLYCSSWVKLQL